MGFTHLNEEGEAGTLTDMSPDFLKMSTHVTVTVNLTEKNTVENLTDIHTGFKE